LGAKESSPFSADWPLSATRARLERGPSGAVSAPLVLCAFSYYGKGGSCAAKDSKAVVQCHKEKTDGAPYGRRRFLFLLQIISFS
jgi:hypothetical protein